MGRLRLVDNWRCCLHWFSVQLHLAATGVIFLLLLMPVAPIDLNAIVPQPWGVILTVAWAVIGLLARIVDQRRKVRPDGE